MSKINYILIKTDRMKVASRKNIKFIKLQTNKEIFREYES